MAKMVGANVHAESPRPSKIAAVNLAALPADPFPAGALAFVGAFLITAISKQNEQAAEEQRDVGHAPAGDDVGGNKER